MPSKAGTDFPNDDAGSERPGDLASVRLALGPASVPVRLPHTVQLRGIEFSQEVLL